MDPADQTLRRNIWVLAAVFVCCMHLVFAAFAIARMNEPEDDDLGAPGIEIAFELASTQTTPSELPPGPESEASAASPPVVEQKTAEKEVDLPKETPVESENPDRLVAVEKTDKPDEKEPEPKTKMTKASEEFCCTGSDRRAVTPECPGGRQIDHVGSGDRAKPATCTRDLAKTTSRPSRQVQAISSGPQPEGRRNSDHHDSRSDGARSLGEHFQRFR